MASPGGLTSNPEDPNPQFESLGGETADKLFETLEEWNDYLERYVPGAADLEPSP
ncbi:MAG: hypothetical protein AMXMBFR37_06000 [Steroidobacteraceae bacterium]